MYFWILKWKIAASRFLKQLLHTYELLTKCEVKMAGYWPSFFFCCFFFCINSQKKNFVNKGFTIRLLGKFCLRDTAGSPERARSLHLAFSGSESQRAISFILPARGASHIINPGYCCIVSACKNISLGVWQQLHLQVFSEVFRGLEHLSEIA